LSDGNPYGVPNGLIFSFPVTVDAKGEYQIVKGLKVSPEAQKRINITTDELLQERKFVEQLLK
jgi:malate/lactate dehydrogenase